jgi:hypothetical protein
MAGESLVQLAWLMRPAHVRVTVVHAGDRPAENCLQRLTGTLGFG